MKKIYIAALSKPYIENASSQEEDEKDVVADEKPVKKNLDNVCLMKNLQTLRHLENPTLKATTETFYLAN